MLRTPVVLNNVVALRRELIVIEGGVVALTAPLILRSGIGDGETRVDMACSGAVACLAAYYGSQGS